MTRAALTSEVVPDPLARIAAYFDDVEGLPVHNPADGARIASVRAADADAHDRLIRAADAARPAWAARTAEDRGVVLRRWYDLLLANREPLAHIVTLESGKPLAEARAEVEYGASFVAWFAEEGRRAYGEIIPSHHPDKRILTLRQPIGTCAAITPWNFPVAMITRKVAPALAAGCAMVVKPAEATPLSALFLQDLAAEAGVPADLFRVIVSGDPATTGQIFCHHPLIRKLSFTGSTRVGKILMAQAAEQVTRLSLELGGNAPFLVFDDADLDVAIEGLMVAKFRNAGQTCVCANRILVQDGVHDAFVEQLTARLISVRMGNGMAEGTEIGPLIDARAAARVAGLIAGAEREGAKRRCGTAEPDAAFLLPTVLTGVTQDMAIANTEIFGPVVPVIRFTSEAEAIGIANATPYGLAAYLFARDAGRIWRVMEGLECGMVAVNDGALSTAIAPFGGVKQSGIGREGGRQGLEEYLDVKYCLMSGLGAER